MKIVIKNGIIHDESGSYKADIAIEDGEIKALGSGLDTNDSKIIDAKGKMLLPGGVDVHTHMDLDLGKYRAVDDFHSGSIAAAYGGTTTIVDHIAFGPKGCSLNHQINEYHKLAKDKSIIDYSFHGVIQHVDDNILNEMEKLVSEGITSFKLYMTYDFMLTDEDILRVLIKAKETGAVIAIHAENHGAIQYLRQSYAEDGKLEPIYHAHSRPAETEAEAINRMIYLSKIAGYPHLYFVHVSTKLGLDEIIGARQRGARNIYCETCPQYLTLTDGCYDKENNKGLGYIMAPPLRKEEDIKALWEGIKNNQVDVIATDHCPFFMENKLDGINDFRLAPGGAPGVEERVEVILTEGVKRGIDISQLISKLSINPAKIFGLYPRKGIIQVGSDADIIIVEHKEQIVKYENRHSKSDYTVYEGYKLDYIVDTVIQRGKLLVENQKQVDNDNKGIFLQRNKI